MKKEIKLLTEDSAGKILEAFDHKIESSTEIDIQAAIDTFNSIKEAGKQSFLSFHIPTRMAIISDEPNEDLQPKKMNKKTQTYRLHPDAIHLLDVLNVEEGKSKAVLIEEALSLYAEQRESAIDRAMKHFDNLAHNIDILENKGCTNPKTGFLEPMSHLKYLSESELEIYNMYMQMHLLFRQQTFFNLEIEKLQQ